MVLAVSPALHMHGKDGEETLTAAGQLGLLTRFPFNHYPHFSSKKYRSSGGATGQ